MKKSCETCANKDLPGDVYPCASCESAYNFPPTKWKAAENCAPDTNVGHKTNADRIREVSDEELLEKLVSHCEEAYTCCGCLIEHECPVNDNSDTTVREDIENWLKQSCGEKALEEAK